MTDSPKLWVDMTNSPHVLVLRPVIEEFERRGWEVTVTAREFAQTIPLLERAGIPHTVISKHRGRNMAAKGYGLAARTAAMVRFGRGKGFDLGLSHASNDLPVAAKVLDIPHVTMFDYEHARLSHHINVRLSSVALVPDAIPVEALSSYGGTADNVRRYPGLKEEYYLADFEPDGEVLSSLGLDEERVLVVVRTPPSMAAYHRMENPVFEQVLARVASHVHRGEAQAVVLVRTPDQRAEIAAVDADAFVVPETVVDAQSLVYYADVVVSGGGTLNREAVALGTPAYTVFQGELGAVDRRLIEEGRLTRLDDASQLPLEKKPREERPRARRPVGDLVDMIVTAGRLPTVT